MSTDSPFSLSDTPKKNLTDGLIVSGLLLLMGIFMVGEWVSIMMFGLFGILFLCGVAMFCIGVVRTIRHGLDGTMDRHLLTAGYRERIHRFFAQLSSRPATGNDFQDPPEWLILTWFLGVLLGPGIGWFMTASVIGNMTESNWQVLTAIRVVLSVPIPVFLGSYLAIRYYLIPAGERVWSIFFLLVSAVCLMSGWASVRDLAEREPAEVSTVIIEYRKSGYLAAPWLGKGYAPNGGAYSAKLADGRVLDFHCPRICLDHYEEGKKINLVLKPVSVTYLRHLKKILEVEYAPK